MDVFKQRYPLAATTVFVMLIVLAHVLASDGYSLVRNTISDLGSQGYPHRWIMRLGFLSFGGVLVLGSLLNGLSIRTLPIALYGACVSCTGIFCAAPFQGDAPVDQAEANLHAVFAQLAGLAFCIGIATQMGYGGQRSRIVAHAVFLAAVILCSALFGLLPEHRGLAQRALYLVSFIWLVKYFRP